MPPRFKIFLTALAGCLSLIGCMDRTSMEKAKALEVEIEQLRRLSSQAQTAAKRLDAKIEAAHQEAERLKEVNAKLQEELEAKSKEVERFKKDFENYKLQYKLSMKTRVQGMPVADLSVDGTTYHHVTLKDLTDTHLTISHDDGVRKVPLNLLPASLRDMLGLNVEVPVTSQPVAALSSKKEIAARKADQEWAVNKAAEKKNGIINRLEEARNALSNVRHEFADAKADHKPIAAFKKAVDDQEKAVAKLETQLVQADIELYQARQSKALLAR